MATCTDLTNAPNTTDGRTCSCDTGYYYSEQGGCVGEHTERGFAQSTRINFLHADELCIVAHVLQVALMQQYSLMALGDSLPVPWCCGLSCSQPLRVITFHAPKDGSPLFELAPSTHTRQVTVSTCILTTIDT